MPKHKHRPPTPVEQAVPAQQAVRSTDDEADRIEQEILDTERRWSCT